MKLNRIVTAAIAVPMTAISCVNAEYDLSKGIDTTVGINGEISAPLIKNTEFISIGDMIKDEDLEGLPIVKVYPNPDDKSEYTFELSLDAEEPIRQDIPFDMSEIGESIAFHENVSNGVPLELDDIDFSEYVGDAKTKLQENVISKIEPYVGLIPAGQEYLYQLNGYADRLDKYKKISIIGNTPGAIRSLVDGLKADINDVQATVNKINEAIAALPEIPGQRPLDPLVFDVNADDIDIDKELEKYGDIAIDIAEEVDFNIDTDIPSIITRLGRIEVDSKLGFALNLSYGKMTAEEGLRIILPDIFEISKADAPDAGWHIEDGHIMVFAPGYEFIMGERNFALSIDAINVPEDALGSEVVDDNRKLTVAETVRIEGKMGCKVSEIIYDEAIADEPIPGNISFDADIRLDGAELQSVDVSLDLSGQLGDLADMEPIKLFDPEDLPPFMEDNKIIFDIYNPAIILDIANGSPLEATLSATIDAFKEGESVFGPQEDDKLNIEQTITANGSRKIAISRKGYNEEDGNIIQMKEDEKIGLLIQSLPEEIRIGNVDVKVPDQIIRFDSDVQNYSFEIDWHVNAPVAFGEELDLEYALDTLTGLNEYFGSADELEDGDMKIDLKRLEIRFDMQNSLPLSLGLEVSPLDKDGDPISAEGLNLNIEFDGKTAAEGGMIRSAGRDGEPQKTEIVISVAPESMKALENLDGLKIVVRGTAGDASGVTLSSKHGIQLEDVTAHVSGGVIVDLGEIQ